MSSQVQTEQAPGHLRAAAPPPAIADPLRATRFVKWLTRLLVYPGVTLLIPWDHMVNGLTWDQAISVHLGGYVIATVAIEFAYAQMFKLRRRSAYPNVVVMELGAAQTLDSAAGQALAVARRLLLLEASFLALGRPDSLKLAAASGLGPEAAQRILERCAPSIREAMETSQPVLWQPRRSMLEGAPPGRVYFVPVLSLHNPIGALVIVARPRNRLVRDPELLRGIGSAIGLSLDNLRQRQELSESEDRLRKQNRILADLAESKTVNRGDLNAAVREITEAAAHALGVERASVWLYNDDRSKIHCIDLYERNADRHSQGLELTAADYPSYFKALEEERVIAAVDARSDPRTSGFVDSYLVPLGITSMMDAPIRVGGHLVGVICHEHLGPVRQWSLEEQNLAGSMADFISLAMETHEHKKAEEALRESESKFRTLADTVAAAAFIYQDARMCYVNSAAEAVTGYSRHELLQMNFWDVIAPDFRETVRERGLARQRGEQMPTRYEVKIQRKDGEERWVDFMAATIEFDGQPAVLGTAFDITERKQAEETIKHLAYHDALTGLPNRTLFMDRLSVGLAQARRHGQSLAVMFLDMDRFKLINDTVGHASGDLLLRNVAQRLTSLIRDGDTVARVGGDEFTLLLPDVQMPEAVEIADRILKVLREPWTFDGHEFHISTSIGIAMFPEDGDDAEVLLRNADTAMYRAKDGGRDNYRLYTATMNAGVVERLELETGLRRALDRGEFVIHYQPQVDIESGKIVGVEALVRWLHPQEGIIPPAEFIPLAEETGLIVPLGSWVLRTACQQNKAWQDAGLPTLRVAVNLSARQFHRRDLAETVSRALHDSGLSPQHLQLEITEGEGIGVRDAETVMTAMRELQDMGVQIAVDDFGTGHSSLSYLKRFPITAVKIDRSFVRHLTTDASDTEIASTIIAMAHHLNLKVVAEGVETEEQLAFLRERQCDEMQGYLFSKPVPAVELEALLRRSARKLRNRQPADTPRP